MLNASQHAHGMLASFYYLCDHIAANTCPIRGATCHATYTCRKCEFLNVRVSKDTIFSKVDLGEVGKGPSVPAGTMDLNGSTPRPAPRPIHAMSMKLHDPLWGGTRGSISKSRAKLANLSVKRR